MKTNKNKKQKSTLKERMQIEQQGMVVIKKNDKKDKKEDTNETS